MCCVGVSYCLHRRLAQRLLVDTRAPDSYRQHANATPSAVRKHTESCENGAHKACYFACGLGMQRRLALLYRYSSYTRIGSNKGKTPEHNQAKHTKHRYKCKGSLKKSKGSSDPIRNPDKRMFFIVYAFVNILKYRTLTNFYIYNGIPQAMPLRRCQTYASTSTRGFRAAEAALVCQRHLQEYF